MESRYDRFGDLDGSVHAVPSVAPPQTGVRRFLWHVLYGATVLLLLVLIIVTAVKFSKLDGGIADVKTQLQELRAAPSGQSAGAAAREVVRLQARVPVRGGCREGWASFRSRCYLLSKTPLGWKQAEEQCQRVNGHLMVPNDMEELDFISEISDLNSEYWIGLVERQHEGHWSWVDGTPFDNKQTYWDQGQPDNWDYRENGEDCGQIHSTAVRKRRRWNDADCGLAYKYVCEASA